MDTAITEIIFEKLVSLWRVMIHSLRTHGLINIAISLSLLLRKKIQKLHILLYHLDIIH
jgi:hypothetical protein